jgi:hypothetical protein
LHLQARADFDLNEFEAYTDNLQEVVVQLRQSDLAKIRNGLDHKRSDEQFPSLASMLAMVNRIQQAVAVADSQRLVPKRYWLRETTVDRFGRGTLTFEDYKRQRLPLPMFDTVPALPTPDFDSPVIIGPRKFLCGGILPIIFSVRTSNEFARYWEGYPFRRSSLPATTREIDEEMEN